MVIVLFGVSGSGKTTVGKLLANDLDWAFIDADDHHSRDNITKMAAGIALDDKDRRAWLEKLQRLVEKALRDQQNIVLACSALKMAYREQLDVDNEVRFVLLKASFDTIKSRLETREGHFMGSGLLHTQFDILEANDLVDLTVDCSLPPDVCVTVIERWCNEKSLLSN
jgi:gluconokinase